MTEKIALADGRADAAALLAACREAARELVRVRHGGAGGGDRERVERGAVRRARGLRCAPLSAHGLRGGDPPRSGRGRAQPRRLCRGFRSGARRRSRCPRAARWITPPGPRRRRLRELLDRAARDYQQRGARGRACRRSSGSPTIRTQTTPENSWRGSRPCRRSSISAATARAALLAETARQLALG